MFNNVMEDTRQYSSLNSNAHEKRGKHRAKGVKESWMKWVVQNGFIFGLSCALPIQKRSQSFTQTPSTVLLAMISKALEIALVHVSLSSIYDFRWIWRYEITIHCAAITLPCDSVNFLESIVVFEFLVPVRFRICNLLVRLALLLTKPLPFGAILLQICIKILDMLCNSKNG